MPNAVLVRGTDNGVISFCKINICGLRSVGRQRFRLQGNSVILADKVDGTELFDRVGQLTFTSDEVSVSVDKPDLTWDFER